MLKEVNYYDLKNGATYNGILKYEGGQEKRRFTKEGVNILFLYSKGKRRLGHRLYAWGDGYFRLEGKGIISFLIPEEDNRTPAKKYLDDVIKYKNYFNKYSHPALWEDIRKEFNVNFNTEGFLNDGRIIDSYTAWLYCNEYNIPKIEGYKTLSCRTAGFNDDIIEAIKKHLDKKENFHYHNHTNYDNSIDGEVWADGSYRAWLSQEYRGCGNGHYYILINSNNALFGEND